MPLDLVNIDVVKGNSMYVKFLWIQKQNLTTWIAHSVCSSFEPMLLIEAVQVCQSVTWQECQCTNKQWFVIAYVCVL
jgi:hypothetical protein